MHMGEVVEWGKKTKFFRQMGSVAPVVPGRG